MGKTWATGLRTVSVPKGTAKPITIVLPFYQCSDFLREQLETWGHYSADLRRFLSALIVDDGSPVHAELPPQRPFPMRLFRIDVDIPWNWLAARNIGAHYAPDGWLLLTDMDHVVPEHTAQALVSGKHDPSMVYAFSRREHTGQAINPHSASFFMTRKMFWYIGGYDERLSGVYGTDGSYRKRVASVTQIKILQDELIRYEYIGDSSVTTLERKTDAMRDLRRRKFALIQNGTPPKVLSFPHHEVVA
jgi:hypothetical protein